MTTYINKDAEWLHDLGQTFISDGDFETGMRLTQIAANVQSLDDKVCAVTAHGEFAAGVREAYMRTFQRSNLPPNERAPAPDMAKVLALAQVTRAPSRKERPRHEPRLRVAGVSDRTLERLAGIKINLNLGRKE